MEDIQKSYLEYGKNRIFLIGDELKDLYLRDIRDGYFDLMESIKDYILYNSRFKWFISVSSSKEKISFFEKNKNLLIFCVAYIYFRCYEKRRKN